MKQIFNPIDSVMLIYTNKCNIKCSHCLFDCSPKKNKKLDLNEVLFLIDFFPELKIKNLFIAGGEPFLYPDEIFKIISKAKNKGIRPTLLSNCFWASTKKRTQEIISKLKNAGTTALVISSDEFHQKFIPQQNIFNVIDAGAKINLTVQMVFSYSKEYDYLDFLANYKDYFSEKPGKKKVFFSFQKTLPIGRALKKIQKKNFDSTKKFFKQKCISTKPTISYDGKGFVCCNVFLENSPVFFLDLFNSGSPKELIESYSKSLFVFYLRTKGPHYIIKLAEKYNLNKINKTKLPEKYVGLCDYCQFNLNQYSRKDLNEMLLKESNKNNVYFS